MQMASKQSKSANRRARRKKLKESYGGIKNSIPSNGAISAATSSIHNTVNNTPINPSTSTMTKINVTDNTVNIVDTPKKTRRRRRGKKKNKMNRNQPVPANADSAKLASLTKLSKKKGPKWLNDKPKSENSESRRSTLINAYCNKISPENGYMNLNNTPIVQTIGLYYRPPLSLQSRKAIASTNMFAEIINDYQNAGKCPFISDEKDRINLLDYIYVRGGALRDVLLERDINDIDLIVDIQGLTKEYDVHLKIYHSQYNQQSLKCSCYLWQRYLKMYKYEATSHRFDDIDEETNMLKKFERNMSRCDFLLNARFFKEIILNSVYNRRIRRGNKCFTISAINTWQYTNWVIHIDKPLMYQGVDLNGCRLDLGDEMSNVDGTKSEYREDMVWENQWCLKQNYWNDCFDYLWELKNSYGSVKKSGFKDIYRNYQIYVSKLSKKRKSIQDVMSINLPIYHFNMKYSLQFCDFTINGMRVPLAMLYDDTNGGGMIDYHWDLKIKQYSNLNDGENMEFKKHNKLAMEDMKYKRISQPTLDVLTTEMVYEDYFWRFVKVLSKFDQYVFHKVWNVGKKTMDFIKDAHKQHFETLDEEKMTEFISRLLIWSVEDGDDYERKLSSRLMIFKMIGIEKDINNAFKEEEQFREILRNITSTKLDITKRKIVYKVLNNFGYKGVWYL